MNKTDISTLLDYNYWANARLWRALLQVTPEQFTAKNTSSHGSLRGTLVHTLFAEMIWRRRLQGEQMPSGFPVETDFPTPQSLCDAWVADEQQMRSFLETLTDEFLQSTLEYKNAKGVPFKTSPGISWRTWSITLRSTAPKLPPCSPTSATHPVTLT